MNIEQGTYDYHLKEPVSVHVNGVGSEDMHLIVLREPRNEHSDLAYKMQQQALMAFNSLQGEKKVDDVGDEVKTIVDVDVDEFKRDALEHAKGLKFAMLSNDVVDVSVFVNRFKTLLTKQWKKPIALFDNKIPVKDVHLDSIKPAVMLDMACTWVMLFNSPFDLLENS